MSNPVTLSLARVANGIRRDSPRLPEHRYALYEERYDWDTLFYDVYRVGPHIVLQGPPLFNFLDALKDSAPFKKAFSGLLPRAKHFGQRKRGEIWLNSDAAHVQFDCALGAFDLPVQPNESDRFAGHRMLVTQSKNNEIRWIVDWLTFHNRIHGATGALIYDNGSTIYTVDELQAAIDAAVPNMDVQVVGWPFRYGAQGGEVAAVGDHIPDWDSDFSQIGVLQHARFRFLQKAKSVMHNDIDELVIGTKGRSVFEAAEQSRSGMVKFDGRWISVHSDHPVDTATHRHADYLYDEGAHVEPCPPKWCIRPDAFGRSKSWGVHNIFDAKANKTVTDEFLFRHFRGVTTSWKYDRLAVNLSDKSALIQDEALVAALARAGLEPGLMAQHHLAEAV